MKLYLSSFRVGREGPRLRELVGEPGRVILVANALDVIEDTERRDEVIERNLDDLREVGLVGEVLDLRSCFDGARAIEDALGASDAVFVTGGNVFVLRRAMRRSGLDALLDRRRRDPDFVYAGYSAGACVAGPTLDGLHLMDDPGATPPGYEASPEWEGLGLTQYMIIPHYQSDHPESEAAGRALEYRRESGLACRALRDGEVILDDADIATRRVGRGWPHRGKKG